ncbi:MAG: histidine ammonia-lyase [Thermoplasmata archaeon]|nr:histidine ammonia-lyase [Thermoplasmata archaeon]
MEVAIDGETLTIDDVHAVAREHAKVVISEDAQARVIKCRNVIQQMIDSGEAIYGVTTGIGEFARVMISKELVQELQRRIVYSHAAGAGDLFPEDAVRGAMLLRANVIAKGYSAVRLEVLESLVEMNNKNVIPVIYEKGSVGTSGDLAPLSQMAEVVMGEGEAIYEGECMSGQAAMDKAGIKSWTLESKEGLGLINGSQMMTAVGALAVYDAEKLLKNAQIASAMTIDALQSVMKAFDPRLHAVRPFKGQNEVAANLRMLFEGSEIIAEGSGKVQDAYSLRCTPQVLGPSKDALKYIREQIEIEMNSAADNPLFFPEDHVHIAGGNFHGQPVSMVLDLLAIAISEVADLSERHTNRLLNPTLSGLPDFLVEGKGLNSGLMVAQYTAAALVSENKVLSHPATVDSISVSADQEDHVSMGPIAARKATEIVKNVAIVIAIEMMCAAQAYEFRKPLKPSKANQLAYEEIRKIVPKLVDDRVLYPDIKKITELVRSSKLIEIVEKNVGKLK